MEGKKAYLIVCVAGRLPSAVKTQRTQRKLSASVLAFECKVSGPTGWVREVLYDQLFG